MSIIVTGMRVIKERVKMSKYNEELVVSFVERELGRFINENQDCLCTTVGETILIMQATADYINDLLQGLTTKVQRSLVVDATLTHTKMLMLAKVGRYEEPKDSETPSKPHPRTRGVGKNTRKD